MPYADSGGLLVGLSLVRMGESVKPMQDILRRLGNSAPKYPGESILSSHPVVEERIAQLEAFGRAQNR